MEEDGGVSEGAELLLSPGDSPMLSSSTGAMGAGGTVFSFEQMKCYRRAFSEDVIDTITSSGDGARRHCVANGGAGAGIRSSEEDTTDDSGDNQDDEYGAQEAIVSSGGGAGGGGGSAKRVGRECCGCHKNYPPYQSPLSATAQATGGQRVVGNTSTPAANGGEPLYISCSETDCSVSTASSVSPHKKQILSCAAIACANGAPGSPHPRTLPTASGAMELLGGGGCCKPSPKINLNYVFALSPLARDDSGFTSGGSPATSTSFPATSPIAIDDRFGTAKSRTRSGGLLLGGNAATSNNGVNGGGEGIFRYDFDELPTSNGSSPGSGTIKSKSAPIFPFSPPCTAGNLSPRFMRTAQRQQQQQQRSRYPSERSSIGSDEQLSDDELSYLSTLDVTGTLNPAGGHLFAVSPGKVGGRALVAARSSLPSQMLSKVLNRNLFRFGRAPLLGTLEESLLQRRLSPKYQVADFKVLLGASGSFCPTQLTIPVASYFYELPGQHLTTPYVCELRLPRKGYSIPRTGTVQATLLNPLGTVVRMFVVPYDFRDMPAMSTTFIRQRILACDESSLQLLGKNIEQLSNAEQMKLLRYAIHLRFQTSRSGKLSLHTDIRLLISRRTDCDTAAAHAKNLLEAPNELKVVTIVPENPKFSLRIDKQ